MVGEVKDTLRCDRLDRGPRQLWKPRRMRIAVPHVTIDNRMSRQLNGASGRGKDDHRPHRTVAARGSWPKNEIALAMEEFNKPGVHQCGEAARMVLL